MKQRFNYLDIRAIVNELRPLILNTYIQNIYSPSNKHYIFKLSSKHLILVEPGARIHLTNTYENVQTHFNIIVRKYLRRNIIKEISQIGFDRVICLVTNKYKIYFEFFAGGNIVITDFDQVIVDLWRTVKEVNVEKGEIYVTNEVVLDYSMEMMYKLGFKDMIGLDRQINEDVRKRVDRKIREIGYCINKEENGICKTNKVEESIVETENSKSDASTDKNSKEKSSAPFANSNCTLSLDECMKNEELVSVYNQFMNDVIQSFKDTANIGTLIYVKGKPNTFMPYKLDKIDYLPSLNEALMVYYKKEEKVLKSKSNIVKDKQEKRIKDLDDEIALCDTKVSIMYENQDKVEHILQAHKSVIEYNLDWKEFEKFKNDQEDLKQLIEKSDFKNKTVALKIEDVKIVCNFMENFNTNINRIYDLKRKIKEKSEKTSKNIKKVVKSVEKKENKVAKKKVKIDRKVYWFEKFNYFIYQNKLIIGGKTAQQNDIIVKKYFTPKDLYFHADIHGASSVILKNGIDNNEDVLTVTGLVALCNSNCWKNKVTSDVYYVNHDQVSKTAESGEYLSTGSFIIRGKKNYLDVFRLEYGIGIIFKKKRKNIDLDDLAIKEEDIHLSFVIDPGMEEIEHALVICGPWVVMKTYKYKEKLLPGVEKKGKLVTEIMKRFCNKLKECENESEVNAVKNISHDEYMAVIINNAKIGKQ